MEIQQCKSADFFAAVATKEFNQTVGSCDIGPDRMRTAAAVIGKMTPPARGKCPRRMSLPV